MPARSLPFIAGKHTFARTRASYFLFPAAAFFAAGFAALAPFIFAQRFRCASAIALRAFALSVRFGFSFDPELSTVLLVPASKVRTRCSLAIS
jgi:hypothetical protein